MLASRACPMGLCNKKGKIATYVKYLNSFILAGVYTQFLDGNPLEILVEDALI